MDFMAGLSAIKHHPGTAPAHAATGAQEAAREARKEAILKVLANGAEFTVDALAVKLNSPSALVRKDVNTLELEGKVVQRTLASTKYIRRSTL